MIQHKHIVIRAEVESPPNSYMTTSMKNWFEELINALGMKVLSGPHVAYCDMVGNKGFTGVCIIETSHVALHIWDEQFPALFEFDVYTCGEMDVNIVIDHIKRFQPVSIEYLLLDRKDSLDILKRTKIAPDNMENYID